MGFADDVTVLLFVLASIQRDVDAFERWEEKHRRGPCGKPRLAQAATKEILG